MKVIEMMAHFKREADLEKDDLTTGQACLDEFIKKGGTFQFVENLDSLEKPIIVLEKGMSVYPVCSGGFCRSQTLWALLRNYDDKIELFKPHAARYGWDPVIGRIRRERNRAAESKGDDFKKAFGVEKSVRFGFENEGSWEELEKDATPENLKILSDFFGESFYGANSSATKRRVYIAFANNAHVVLKRLNEVNDDLSKVTVIAIESEDVMTHPPDFLKTSPGSEKSFRYFYGLLEKAFDFSRL